MSDSIVSGDRCYYCGMEVWQETTSWLGEDDLSYNCREAAMYGVNHHHVRHVDDLMEAHRAEILELIDYYEHEEVSDEQEA